MSENNSPSWPTMAEGIPTSEQWPTLADSLAPATIPAADPLAVPRHSLAPQAMPGRENPATPPEQTEAVPGESHAPTDTVQIPCPHCAKPVASYESFCEWCGGVLTPTSAPPPVRVTDDLLTEQDHVPTVESELDDEVPVSRSCHQCDGVMGPDGYCSTCGAKAVPARDHWREEPAPWVGGCTDRGVRHYRNEDAIALAAEPEPGSRAILVVCDGVSSSQDSDRGSLAAAQAARASLTQIDLTHDDPDVVAALALGVAAQEANAAIIATTDPASTNAASATFIACIVSGAHAWLATLGDSRVYWIGDDPSTSAMLSIDDSVAQERIMLGVDRKEAENGPGGHAITRWLGRDADDVSPRTSMFSALMPGYLLACTDGLWNYCSDAQALGALIGELRTAKPHATPVELAQELVAWANSQGGKDNISVALARMVPETSADTPRTSNLTTPQSGPKE
ncbi:MAG: PP2C family protein-serine/threonine phosphatase [Propionibacteriaceae bacterium]